MTTRIIDALVCVMAFVLVLCLVGCSASDTPVTTEPVDTGSSVSSAQTSTDTSSDGSGLDVVGSADAFTSTESASTLSDYTLTVEGIAQEDVPQYLNTNCSLVGDPDGDYYAHILLSTTQTVTDFTLWSLDCDVDDDGNLIIHESSRTDDVVLLTPECPVLINAELGETLPLVGFSLLNPDGVTEHYFLSESGEDGSILLTAYQPAE